jgi:hypothetical protein
VLQNVDDMAKVKGSCDVQETPFLCGLAIQLVVHIDGYVQKSWTQASDPASLNLMFISHVCDADDSTFSIDRDLGLSMIPDGREIHLVLTEVTIITPRISLLHAFSCFNQFTFVRVLRERSLHLYESLSRFVSRSFDDPYAL